MISRTKTILFLSLLTAIFAVSCNDDKVQKGALDPTSFRTPITKAFEYTETKPIEWQVVDPDSIDLPQTYSLSWSLKPFRLKRKFPSFPRLSSPK